jgi:hypothetical protein
MDELLRPIDLEAALDFGCTPSVACFNACCRDLNQFLTPYDVLRLKQALGLSSTDFLSRCTRRHEGPESGLPVVVLKPEGADRRTCPMLTPAGCRVYPHRPSSCRTYPLVRLARRCRETGRISSDYMLLKEPHCLGFEAGGLQTVRQWIAAQGVAEYDRWNDRLLEVVSLKNRLCRGPLPRALAEEIHTALYDLDRFRSRRLDGPWPPGFSTPPEAVRGRAREDDETLLEVGLQWAQWLLEKALARSSKTWRGKAGS